MRRARSRREPKDRAGSSMLFDRDLLSQIEMQRWEDNGTAIDTKGQCSPVLLAQHHHARRVSSVPIKDRSSHMKWVTRERPKVDRIACPWLIKRFVDPEAEFLYAPANLVLDIAERDGATPYDVPNVELGHHGDSCSFDAIIDKYDLTKNSPALARLALIVRGADTQQHDLTPESRGLLAIAQGFSEAYGDDHEQLAAESPVYDALYAWCQVQDRDQ